MLVPPCCVADMVKLEHVDSNEASLLAMRGENFSPQGHMYIDPSSEQLQS